MGFARFLYFWFDADITDISHIFPCRNLLGNLDDNNLQSYWQKYSTDDPVPLANQ